MGSPTGGLILLDEVAKLRRAIGSVLEEATGPAGRLLKLRAETLARALAVVVLAEDGEDRDSAARRPAERESIRAVSGSKLVSRILLCSRSSERKAVTANLGLVASYSRGPGYADQTLQRLQLPTETEDLIIGIFRLGI